MRLIASGHKLIQRRHIKQVSYLALCGCLLLYVAMGGEDTDLRNLTLTRESEHTAPALIWNKGEVIAAWVCKA